MAFRRVKRGAAYLMYWGSAYPLWSERCVAHFPGGACFVGTKSGAILRLNRGRLGWHLTDGGHNGCVGGSALRERSRHGLRKILHMS